MMVIGKMYWQWIIFAVLQIFYVSAQEFIGIDLNISDKNNKNINYYKQLDHDPSRTYISIYSFDNYKFISNTHANENGIFKIPLDENITEYILNFHSLDLYFGVSSQFIVSAKTDKIRIQHYLPYLHNSLKVKLPYIEGSIDANLVLDNNKFQIGMTQSRFLEPEAGIFQLLNSIPFIAPIINNRWLTIGFISVIIVALLPTIITYFDPEFSERIVQSQMESREKDD